VTVVLRIQRSSGSTEIHRLPAVGDYVVVPRGLLSADDVVGFDAELAGPDRCTPNDGLAAADRGERTFTAQG
jgi:hypothetical protein